MKLLLNQMYHKNVLPKYKSPKKVSEILTKLARFNLLRALQYFVMKFCTNVQIHKFCTATAIKKIAACPSLQGTFWGYFLVFWDMFLSVGHFEICEVNLGMFLYPL